MKKILLSSLCFGALMIGCQNSDNTPSVASKTELKTPSEKLSYIMGMGLGQKAYMMTAQDSTVKLNMDKVLEGVQSVLNQKDTSFSFLMGVQMGLGIKDMLNKSAEDTAYKIDPTIVLQALKAAYAAGANPNAKFLLSQEDMIKVQNEYRSHLETKATAKVAAESKALLEANKKNPGVVVTASGLQYQILRQGAGAKPTMGQSVLVAYKGTLTNGTVFDENAGAAFSLQANGLIKGWIEALQLMNVGSKLKLWVPAELAYGLDGVKRNGPYGQQTVIPANAALVFEVELKEVGDSATVAAAASKANAAAAAAAAAAAPAAPAAK